MDRMLRLVALLLFLLTGPQLFSQVCDCLTTGNCPVPINDNGTFIGTLDVTVNGANDLGACPLTSVCFSITHTWVGDLSVSLISPSGLNYLVMADVNNSPGGCGTDADNLEVCITPGTGNALTNNTEYICNPGPCFSGNCCLTGNWTMPCGGVTDPFAGATQSPTCDLNDFNVPGNPANGTWSLVVNDICAQDVGTLNNFSLTFACGVQSCVVCEADGGELNAPDVQACFGDPSLALSLPPNYNGPQPNPGEYGYGYVISQNGTIMQVNPTADMSAQPPGTYQVCGLSYLLLAQGETQSLVGMNLQTAISQLESPTAPFCGDFSLDCIDVVIGPAIPPTFLDTMVCLGDCIQLANQQVCNSGIVTLQSYLGCDSDIVVTLIPIFIDPIQVDTFLCSGDCVTLGGQQYCPPGAATITYDNYQGCDSIVTYLLVEEVTIAVINPSNPPPLSCANPTLTLNGTQSVPANVSYLWNGPGGPMGTDPAIQASVPGNYTLTVTNNNLSPPCIATTSVTVAGSQDGPELQLNGSSPTICAGQTFDLATLNIVDLNNTSPVITFHSASPATPANELPSTIVSPTTTTTYYVLGTVGNCFDELPVTVTVNPIPSSDFTVTSPICVSENSTVTYTESASPNATYTWNFGGGTATPGTGPGPHSVVWATGGTKTITLSVAENGCTSIPTTQTVLVEVPIAAPVINCNPTTTGILFTWGDIPGATDYNVTVGTGQTGTFIPPTAFEVNGLMPNETVTITVEAVSGNACPNATTTITCTAQDCPPVIVTIDPVDDICLDGNNPLIALVASQTGGQGGGTFTFSGPGVNPANSTFDPAAANPGSNTVNVTYAEGTCTYNASTTIVVNPQPTATFTVTSPICVENSATVNYTGNADSGATYTWDFDGGTATPGTGPGPHSVTWPTGGTYSVSLMVEENDCPSEMAAQTVQVDNVIPDPVVTCNANTSSVEFSWNNVPGATDYTVTVLAGPPGTMTSDTSILFDGLSPNDIVSIEILANGPGACGSTIVQANCEAQDCPSVTINIDPLADICRTVSTAPFELGITITGGAGNGTMTVSGPGITDPVTGNFDPAQANTGPNLITVTYEEGNCLYTGTTTINVYNVPVPNFTVSSPICEANTATVTFTGTPAPGQLYAWNFDGGTATPGTGQGPHTVTWPAAGSYTVSLALENAQGCVSEPLEQPMQVDPELVAPTIDCATTSNSIEFSWLPVANAADYQVVLAGPTGTFDPANNTYTVTGLNPGDAVTIELTVSGTGACPPVTVEQTCAADDCPAVQVSIDPVSPICLATATLVQLTAAPAGGTWSGPGITNPTNGTFDPMVAGDGTHAIIYDYVEGNCSYDASIDIEVFAVPSAAFSATANICEADAATVAYTGNASTAAVYTWDFDGGTATPGTGPGPHAVTWDAPGNYTVSLNVEQDGCASQTTTQPVQVDPELVAPNISCSSTTSSIEFSWPPVANAVDYQVTVTSGPAGTLDLVNNTYTVTGLNPDDEVSIELTVSGNGACPPVTSTETCFAIDCPPVFITIDPVAPLCLGAAVPVQLTADPAGGTWSGPGIIDPVNGVFDATAAGAGNHQITYEFANGNCSYDDFTFLQVFAEPTASFTATQTICVTAAATVTYTGNASVNSVYTWDFGGGTATPGTGPGPHSVTWPAGGSYPISLQVEQNGCASQIFTLNTQVDEELAAPNIDCDATTGSVEFSWNAVPGGSGYDVAVLSGASGTQSGNSYAVTSLQPGDEVCIELTVSGSTVCGPVTVQACCTASDCPPVQIQLTPVDPLCLEAGTAPVNLEATVTGGSGQGAGTWSGTGITNPAAGVFDPLGAGAGSHVLTYTYQEDATCSYSESMTVNLTAPPTADAGPTAELTCQDDQMDAELGGTGSSTGPDFTYSWSAANGPFPGDSTVLNPVVVQAGTYTLTVTNTALGCSATDVVTITASQDLPEAEISIVPISCFGENDGLLAITGVTGGEGPFLFSLNGSAFSSQATFNQLEPGLYDITVLDANGCESTLTVNMEQPQEVNVELLVFIDSDNIIHLGDPVNMVGVSTIPEDSLDLIQWEPAGMVDCDSCLQVSADSVIQQTHFSITIEENGCADSDGVTIFVKKDRPVYVPNAFSPNGDAVNDVFMIFGGQEVAEVKSFLVFDRWGETMFQFYNFEPNDPASGWNGTHRGEFVNPAVFTWFAEVEFIDGSVELLEGDVTLVR